jgi:sulfide dehydrogenase cytochrome subunit
MQIASVITIEFLAIYQRKGVELHFSRKTRPRIRASEPGKVTCSWSFRGDLTVRHRTSSIAGWVLLAGLGLAYPAAAEDQGAHSLAANCTGCHGPGGNSSGAIPTIAALDRAYIVTALREFKAGTRQATVMHQHAKGYTDQEIEILAEYFSRQKRP